jgi:hypothetical protein
MVTACNSFKFLEIDKLYLSKGVTSKLNAHFARIAILIELALDNVPTIF